MSTFSESSFSQKLSELNNSQQSIQTLSLWLIHHRKHAEYIIEMWLKEMQSVKPSKKLTFIYLANDVIQNSRKKGNEFLTAFASCLEYAFRDTVSDADDKTVQSLGRLCDIWLERKLFDNAFLEKLQLIIETEEPGAKRAKLEAMMALKEDIELVQDSPREPPDADELVKALENLENAASSDASVREKIAALPPEVSDVSLLDKIKDKTAADRLSKTVNSASLLLGHYNGCLAQELEDRRHLSAMIKDFTAGQKEQLTEAESRLEEYKSKLDRVAEVRKELKMHIQSLPDLTLLPAVTGGLAPLPSAGDLFNIEKALNI